MKELNQKIVFVHAGPLRPAVPSGHLPRRGAAFSVAAGAPPVAFGDSPPPVEGAFGAGAPFEPPGISAGSPRQRARWFAMTLLFERFDAMYGQVALHIF